MLSIEYYISSKFLKVHKLFSILYKVKHLFNYCKHILTLMLKYFILLVKLK